MTNDKSLEEYIDALYDERDRLRAENAELREALADLLGKLEVMSGCNEHDMDEGGEEEWPEFQAARAALAKAKG